MCSWNIRHRLICAQICTFRGLSKLLISHFHDFKLIPGLLQFPLLWNSLHMVIAQNITGLYKITTVVEFKMNIYTCTYFKQQTVIRLGTIFTQVRLALAMIQVNASVLHLSV